MEKVGVYICSGCDIDKLDIDRLKNVAKEEFGIEAKVHPHLCSKDGVELINNDLSELDAVVIAACSPRVKTAVFTFDGKYVERANLREGVVWSHDIDVHAQELAEDYLRIAITKAQKAEKPEPYLEEVSKDILVVGGGVTGLTAALEIAKAGKLKPSAGAGIGIERLVRFIVGAKHIAEVQPFPRIPGIPAVI